MTDRKSGSARQQPSGTQMPNPREVAVSDNFGPTPPVLIEEVEAIERHLYDLLDHLFETPAPCGASAPHRSSGMRTHDTNLLKPSQVELGRRASNDVRWHSTPSLNDP